MIARLPGKLGWWLSSFSHWLRWMIYCERAWRSKQAAMDFGEWQSFRLTPLGADAAGNEHDEAAEEGTHGN